MLANHDQNIESRFRLAQRVFIGNLFVLNMRLHDKLIN